jgi:nicotinamide mononucleotide transporter
MNEVWQNIATGLSSSSPLDRLNLVLGLMGVGLMIRRSLWAFPVGLAAVSVQGVLFYRAAFPAEAALQVFFFVTLAWGWWHWVKDRGAAPELPVTTLTPRGRLLTLLAAGGATAAWALLVAPRVHSVMPWRDAFIAMFSVAAQVLQARKKVENWPLWIVVNVVAVASYWSAALAFTAVLYLVYLGLAFAGWWTWTRVNVGPVSDRPGQSETGPTAGDAAR